ncbi:hypothetical protein ABEF95_004801 [Exophiala dermatitidis]
MSSSNWQDRRFMFPAGKEVHQGSRRYSGSQPKENTSSASSAPPPTPAAPAAPATDTNTITDVTNASADSGSGGSSGKVLPRWDGDRRFMFPAPREIHEPAQPRRMSGSSGDKKAGTGAAASSPPKSSTSSSGGIAAAIAGRRRSSASSQGAGGGMFSGLLSNRSSDTHAERRQSWEEMKSPGGLGGFLSGLVNKPEEKK